MNALSRMLKSANVAAMIGTKRNPGDYPGFLYLHHMMYDILYNAHTISIL